MSLRTLVEAGDRPILTAEAPVVDGGSSRGVPGADRRAGALGGRDERNRQYGRSRARIERRGGDRPRPGRCRADPPGRLPRQEPDRLPGGYRRGCVSRGREHLLPDRRRRHGRGRARSAASVRPRRPAADRRSRPASRRAATSRDARSSPHPRCSSAPSRTRPRRRSSTVRSGRRRRSRPARASCSSRSATTRTGSRPLSAHSRRPDSPHGSRSCPRSCSSRAPAASGS